MTLKKIKIALLWISLYPIFCYMWYLKLDEEPPYLWLFLGYIVFTIIAYFIEKYKIQIGPRSQQELDDIDDQINDDLKSIKLSKKTISTPKNIRLKEKNFDNLL